MTWDGGALTADVVTSTATEARVELTQHRVETGGTIADHGRSMPKTVTFEFAQSSQPLKMVDLAWAQVDAPIRKSLFRPTGLLLLTTAAGAALQAAGEATGLLSGGPSLKIWSLTNKDPDADRIQDLHDQLLELLDGITEVSFTWRSLVLTGYRLTSVSRSTKSGSGGLARFTIEAHHVQTVETAATSLLGGFPVPSVLSSIPLLNVGKKGSQPIEDGQYERSLGASDIGVDLLGGAF